MPVIMPSKPFIVLMAEDSEHDVRAAQRIWAKNAIKNPLRVVKDGQECLDYLLRQGQYTDPDRAPRPGVLLLDISMPRMDGFEVLKRIKSDSKLRRLPVVVMTTSGRNEDIVKSYDLGASAFLTKPVGLDKLNEMLVRFNEYWQLAGLPEEFVDGNA